MFKKTLKSEIIINAEPQKIWNILMDFQNYPIWNPFIIEIKGSANKGEMILTRIVPTGASEMKFKPTILNIENDKELRWLGHFIISGLFDGEHVFQLIDNKNGTTTFIQSENFKGILVPLFKKLLDVNTLNGFELMNQQLKKEAEK